MPTWLSLNLTLGFSEEEFMWGQRFVLVQRLPCYTIWLSAEQVCPGPRLCIDLEKNKNRLHNILLPSKLTESHRLCQHRRWAVGQGFLRLVWTLHFEHVALERQPWDSAEGAEPATMPRRYLWGYHGVFVQQLWVMTKFGQLSLKSYLLQLESTERLKTRQSLFLTAGPTDP